MEYVKAPLNELEIEVMSTKISRVRFGANSESKLLVIKIKNSDTICMARAIFTALTNLHKDQCEIYNGFNKSQKLQTENATSLHQYAGVEVKEHGNTTEDVDNFANFLGCKINIVDSFHVNHMSTPKNSTVTKYIF